MNMLNYDTSLTKAHSSEDIVKNGVCKFSVVKVDIRGDNRIEELTKRLKKQIEKNHWKIPENEKEIVGSLAKMVHSKEFYGEYNKDTGNNIDALTNADEKCLGVINRIKELEKNKSRSAEQNNQLQQLKKEEEGLVKDWFALKKKIDNTFINGNNYNLKDIKAGRSDCKNFSLVFSAVLHKVGIPNDLCSGSGSSEDIMCGVGHVFIQSRLTKNIIEAVPADKFYFENINGKSIREGQIVAVRGDNGTMTTYGGGDYSFVDYFKMNVTHSFKSIIGADTAKTDVTALIKTAQKNISHELAEILKNKGIEHILKTETIVATAQILGENLADSADRGNRVAGIKIGKSNPDSLNLSEIRHFLKQLGVKLSDEQSSDLKKNIGSGLNLEAAAKDLGLAIALLDKNNDGKISAVECKDIKAVIVESVMNSAKNSAKNKESSRGS